MPSKIRILHVLKGLNAGGVERWLLSAAQHLDPLRFQLDFGLSSSEPALFDDDFRSAGAGLYYIGDPNRPLDYASRLIRFIRERGGYDVVHSHVHFNSGWVLSHARLAGVPTRIAHSHNDTRKPYAMSSVARQLYLLTMAKLIHRNATFGLAASQHAATALFGEGWEEDARWRVLHYGIELAPFEGSVDMRATRIELGLPPDAIVIGHVGRFDEQKNHGFILRVFEEIARLCDRARLLLVGTGPLAEAIGAQARAMGIDSMIVFAGVRKDIPRLMLGAMDLFLFPSHYEGLGLVLVEAQAAGLPCLISDAIPREAQIVADLVRYLPLRYDPEEWARIALDLMHRCGRANRGGALRDVQRSDFNIETSARQLADIYAGSDVQRRFAS